MAVQANLYAEKKTVPSYEGSRPDIVAQIAGACSVLDVGCNRGAVVRELKTRFPGCRCWGIEINPEALADALPQLEQGFSLDLDDPSALKGALDGLQFDTIIAGDVLEHTWNPWRIVEVLFEHLTPGGAIFISLPNIGHWSLLLSWFRLSWPLRERGLYDGTHRRFFMRRDLERLAPKGAAFTLLGRNVRLFEARPSRWDRPLRLLTQWIPLFKDWVTFQYIFAIRNREQAP